MSAPASHTSRGFWRQAGTIASWVVLAVTLLLAAILVLPTLLGFQRYVIISGSMVPTISVGSVVYDEVVPVEDLAVGDIITFVPPPEYGIDDPVTHRITVIDTDDGRLTFRTQGDANSAEDPWTMVLDGPDQARVVHVIPYVGYFYMALNHGWVQLLVIGIPAIGIAVFMGVGLWKMSGEAVLEERARKAQEATTAPAEDVSS